MAGFVGSRSYYEYTNDGGTKYLLLLDDELSGLAGTGLTKAQEGTTATPAPKRFKPRFVYWQDDVGTQRKKIVCNPEGTFYKRVTATALTIDEVEGKIVSRVGEKLTMGNLAAAAPAV